MSISNSPGLEISDDIVPIEGCPFAYRMMKFFEKESVVVTSKPAPDFTKDPMTNDELIGWNQFNITKNEPEELALEIINKLGFAITFTEMPRPETGVDYVSSSFSGNVRVRRILLWWKDSMIQRWDVWVKKAT